MPSSYTPRLRLVLPANGELVGLWGQTVNTGLTSLVDQAVAGTGTILLPNANYTLTALNETLDEARNMFLTLTGNLTAQRDVICPPASKLYFVWNNTTGGQNIRFKTAAGTGIVVAPGQRRLLQCDGTNVVDAVSVLNGNASTADLATLANAATVLQTARTINGVSFNGSANILINLNNSIGFNTSGSGDAGGTTFNGSTARTISYNTIGAPSTTGTNASGTWAISITGNAATVTNGAYLAGTQTFTGLKLFNAGINLPDSVTLRLGTSNEGQLYHTGAEARFDLTVGNFLIRDAAVTRFTFARSTGAFTATGLITGADVASTSDRRIKSDIKQIRDALAKVCTLTGYTYVKKGLDTRQTGLIAQEVDLVLPEAVNKEGEYMSLSYGAMMGLIVEAIKELTVRLDRLEGQ